MSVSVKCQSVVIRPRPGSLSALRREAKQMGLRGRTRMSKEELLERLNDNAPTLNKSELKERGWTERTIALFLGEPDDLCRNPRYACAAPTKLYRRPRVELAEASPCFQTLQSRRRKRSPAKPKIVLEPPRPDYAEQWPDWLDALPLACDNLFQLNRHAKYMACDRFTRQRIYALKGRMIKLLHRRGHCVTCYLHERSLPEQECRRCDGTGEDDGFGDYDSPSQPCLRCGGSGIYRAARVVQYYCFRFLVDEVYYSWHQPVDTVDFNVIVTADPQQWREQTEVQAVELGWSRVRESLGLLEWVLKQGEKDRPGEVIDAADDAVPRIG